MPLLRNAGLIILSASALLAGTACGPSSTRSSPRHRASGANQQVRLSMHPQIAQPGRRPASAQKARTAMTATFEPAHEGRVVQLQRRQGSRWQMVAQAKQDRRGIAEFSAAYAAYGHPAEYRVRAKRSGRLRGVASRAVTTSKWGNPDFSDEFSGHELGPDWSHRLQGYSRESKRACSKADPRAVEVTNGVVQLSVMKDPDRVQTRCEVDGKSFAWRLNGHIGTQGTRSFTYGYAAARIKFQPLRGQHGSFWLQPATREADEGPASKTGAEIDVSEWFGDQDPQGGLTSFVYQYPEDGKPGVTGEKIGGYIDDPQRFGQDWATKFHVFSVEWTREQYVFRIDGKETFHTSKGVSGQPEFLILSLLSSDYELPWLKDESQLPQHMDVDWVRYWED